MRFCVKSDFYSAAMGRTLFSYGPICRPFLCNICATNTPNKTDLDVIRQREISITPYLQTVIWTHPKSTNLNLKTENPRVGGSTPSLATIKFNNLGLPIRQPFLSSLVVSLFCYGCATRSTSVSSSVTETSFGGKLNRFEEALRA